MTEIFCDGSVSPSVLTDEFTSFVGDKPVGRIIVVIPSLDYGFLERVHVPQRKGNPDTNAIETMAIEKALAVAAELGLTEFVVFSDCDGVVQKLRDRRVHHRNRDTSLAGAFFEKVWSRGAYLRRTRQTLGTRRRPRQPHQTEIFELLRVQSRQFRLSESPLWGRVQRDFARVPPGASE